MSARVYGYVVGLGLLLIGVFGFLWTGFQGWDDHRTDAVVLGVQLNPTQNLLHLAIGVALLLAASAMPGMARSGVATVAMLLLVLAGAGSAVLGAPEFNVLALNTGANVLHGILGAAGVLAVAAGPSRNGSANC